LTK
ncbi:hypothetical protein VCHC50A2_3179B, partial [Vibrio cholerae HC-50A2]|jgi:hypothetical protein